MDYEGRVANLQKQLQEMDADGLLVTDLINVRYLTGFSGTNGQLLVTANTVLFMTDGRYEARSKELVKGAEIAIYYQRLTDVLGPALERSGVARLGVEAKSMTLAERDDLAPRVDTVELVTTSGLVEELRRAKEPAEVELIRQAVAVADVAYGWVLDRLKPGRTEQDIAFELEVHIRTGGAQAISFEPIVGSGPLSAHIHHSPSDRALQNGDLVLMDLGAKVDGYCSDITRTVVLGPASDEQSAIYETVLAANSAACSSMVVGAACRDIDGAARDVIEAAGHGQRFGHGLGHGVGLDIHEAPRCAKVSEDELVAGDVVTDEPGVYVPDFGGVRIEDCVLVTHDGPEVLTTAPKDALIEL